MYINRNKLHQASDLTPNNYLRCVASVDQIHKIKHPVEPTCFLVSLYALSTEPGSCSTQEFLFSSVLFPPLVWSIASIFPQAAGSPTDKQRNVRPVQITLVFTSGKLCRESAFSLQNNDGIQLTPFPCKLLQTNVNTFISETLHPGLCSSADAGVAPNLCFGNVLLVRLRGKASVCRPHTK